MKLKQLTIPKESATSFSVRQDQLANVNSMWHYHPEVELILIHKGSGLQFIGDNVQRFKENDILLIGSNLPHYFKFDESSPPAAEGYHSTVIHFNEIFWGSDFLNLPENAGIKEVLEQAKKGIALSAIKEPKIGALFTQISSVKDYARIFLLAETLALIGQSTHSKTLAWGDFKFDQRKAEKGRMEAIFNFVYKNFRDPISLSKISGVANLAPNAFCRFFKAKTGKNYTQFVNEIKIKYACGLLADGRLSVKEICFESGFNNFSSYHEMFKRNMGMTPMEYRNFIVGKQTLEDIHTN